MLVTWLLPTAECYHSRFEKPLQVVLCQLNLSVSNAFNDKLSSSAYRVAQGCPTQAYTCTPRCAS
jgi:hypothetical protein